MTSKYSQENLLLACRAVTEGMSGIKAARIFKVPKTTLYRRMQKGQVGEEIKLGRPNKLTPAEEQRLVDWFVYCKYMGFINMRNTWLSVEAKNIAFSKNPLSTEKFSKDWLQNLIERHRKIRDAIKRSTKKKYFDKPTLELWFKGIETYCKEHEMLDVLKKPAQLYYCCKLQLNEHTKVMLSYSAEGMATPPLLVFENSEDSNPQALEDFESCILPKGWAKLVANDSENKDFTLMYYLKNILNIYLLQKNIPQPIFVFMDFQNQPISLELYELNCKLSMFIINTFPTGFKLTQTIQAQLTENIEKLPSSSKNLNSYLDILKTELITQLTKENMFDHFAKSGIYPFDINQVNLSYIPVYFPPDEPIGSEQQKTATNPEKNPKYLSFNEFQNMLDSNLKTKLEVSLSSNDLEELNSAEFNVLLKIYRKLAGNTDNSTVEVQNEPLSEDPLNESYVGDEMEEETEDIKPFDQWL